MDMLLSESCSPLRMIGWTLIQVDAVSCVTIVTGLVVFLADLIVSRISEDDLRSWATINRGAFVLTR